MGECPFTLAPNLAHTPVMVHQESMAPHPEAVEE
jgi:hypothetical protein